MMIKIDEKDLEQIKQAFESMYNSFTTINFCEGGNAGMAQQKALNQMSSFVKVKNRNDTPLSEYLKKIDADNRKKMSEYIMKSDYSKEVFEGKDVERQTKLAEAKKNLKTNFERFNAIYRKYKPVQQNGKNKLPTDEYKQYMIQMYFQMVKSHNHGA